MTRGLRSGYHDTIRFAMSTFDWRTLRWRPVPVRVPSGGSTLHGHVSLAGLKPGRYTLVVSVAVAGQTNERGAELVVDGGSVAQVKSVNSER